MKIDYLPKVVGEDRPRRIWQSREFNLIAIAFLIFDSLLVLAGRLLQFPGAFAFPVFVLNLPSIPLAIIYSGVLEDPMSIPAEVLMWASEIIISSLVWSYVVIRLRARVARRR